MISIIILSIVTNAAGQIIYVDNDANGLNDGTSWSNAYNFLQDALADANSSPKPIEIRVAQGTYTPDSNSTEPIGTGDREATFKLINGVTLKGGYAGFGEPDPNARDIDLYDSILTGDLYGNDADVSSTYELLHDPNRAENIHHVVTGSGTDATAILDGFILIAGNAYTWPDYRGGGIYIQEGSPTVINCKFRSNLAGWGGGIYCGGGSPLVSQCRFTGNWAEDGGGVYCISSSLTIRECIFNQNEALLYGGGAIYCCDNSEANIIDCIVEENWAYNWAGGIGFYDSNCLIINCTIGNNLASGYGGGVYLEASKATIIDCDIINNQAHYEGGGIYNWISNVRVVKCRITNNVAWCVDCHDGGGGLCNRYDSTLDMVSCIFKENSSLRDYYYLCRGYGGGIDNSAIAKLKGCTFVANSATYGAGISNRGELIVTNCTFSGNSAAYEGGGMSNFSNIPMVMNCIFWGNRPEEIYYDEDTGINVKYSDVQGGWSGQGNINVDPCFADPGYWDTNGTPEDVNDDFWIDGDYHLQSEAGRWNSNSQSWVIDSNTSPCIDAGDMASPIGYEPFPNGGRINMGAYGGTAEASKSYFGTEPCETIVAGDINGDCIVNFKDLAFMAYHWLEGIDP